MKARNKLEKEVESLSAKIPQDSLNESQLKWLAGINYGYYAPAYNGKFWCPNCGKYVGVNCLNEHVLNSQEIVCPHCKSKLETTTGNTNRFPYAIEQKRVVRGLDYVAFANKVGTFQLMRYFVVRFEGRLNKGLSITGVQELVRTWSRYGQDNVVESVGYGGQGCYYWDCPFSKYAALSIKCRDYKIDTSLVYPRSTWSNDYKRFGLSRIKEITEKLPLWEVKDILKDDHALTLSSKGWYSLLRCYLDERSHKDELFSSIKIALRNDYSFAESKAILWKDYVNLVRTLGLDIRNAFYVCPDNLEIAHDALVRRNERKEMKKLISEMSEQNKDYVQRISKFSDFVILCGDMKISVLPSVFEFKHEADILHHCVFSNKYYEKVNSLILSARIEGVPIETIEISLKDYRILQCHGDHNQASPYHEQIVSSVRSSLPTIRKLNKKTVSTVNNCANIS